MDTNVGRSRISLTAPVAIDRIEATPDREDAGMFHVVGSVGDVPFRVSGVVAILGGRWCAAPSVEAIGRVLNLDFSDGVPFRFGNTPEKAAEAYCRFAIDHVRDLQRERGRREALEKERRAERLRREERRRRAGQRKWERDRAIAAAYARVLGDTWTAPDGTEWEWCEFGAWFPLTRRNAAYGLVQDRSSFAECHVACPPGSGEEFRRRHGGV